MEFADLVMLLNWIIPPVDQATPLAQVAISEKKFLVALIQPEQKTYNLAAVTVRDGLQLFCETAICPAFTAFTVKTFSIRAFFSLC